MADNLRKYTTQEVLNKVYTDSSGDTIGLQAQTSKETLNAVLNTSTNSLNVSLGGSNTISGDVTITGDLTVQGGGSLAFDEIIEGTSQVKVDNTSAFLVEKADGTDVFIVDTTNSNVKIPNGLLELGTADSTSGHINAFENMSFNIDTDNDDTNRFFEFAINGSSGAGTELMRLTEGGQLGVGTSSPEEKIHSTGAIVSTGVNDTGATAGTERAFIDLVSNKARIGHFRGTTSAGSGGLQFYTDSVERARLDASGNFGIGISPVASQKLHVNVASNVNFTTSANSSSLRLNAVNDAVSATIPLEINSTNTKFLSNVGIGTSPDSELEIFHATDPQIKFSINTHGDAGIILGDADGVKIFGKGASNEVRLYSGASTLAFRIDDNSRISLSNNDAGSGNTVFGQLAGNSIQAGGNNNVIIGDDAGLDLTTADENVLVGKSAGANLTTSDDNVAIGASALATEVDGTRNVAVGYQSLTAQSGSSATYNTALGYVSGDVITTGTQNTLIGAITDPSANNGTNQTVIGYNATGQADNSVTLGNADVTAVYMAQDKGATIFASGATFEGSASQTTIDLKATANNYIVGLSNDSGRIDLRPGGATALTAINNGNVSVTGALSKGSGSFKINHPLESKKDTHHLVHSFVEAPQADNIYRGKATLSNGSVEINLDTVSGMSEGTFVLLNTDIQCFTSNESDWDAVKGSVSGNILTISCQNTDSTADVSWLVIGERQDDHMKETDWTDEKGKVIVEPEKTE